MNFEPYSRYNDPSQQPGRQVASFGNPNGQGYNAAPAAHFSHVQPVMQGAQATPPPWSNAAATAQPPSFLLALFSFPLVVLTTYAWPTSTTFARHKNSADRGVLVILLALLAGVTGICAYAWGRLPTLDRGIEALSINRLVPHSLSLTLVMFLSLLPPLLLLAWAGALHYVARTQQGQGTYRMQLYSALVIETPLVLFLIAVALLLFVAPPIGTIARVPFAAAGLLLVLYSLLLYVPSLMTVQNLSARKSWLCLVSVLVVVLLLVVFVSMLFGDWDTSSNRGGSGNRHFKRKRSSGRERTCPHCGFSLEVYDQLHRTALTQSCPRCGGPLA
ncbi:MAG: YIP1 family protein [Ktedonobacteraceae bacterium]|nr:YIP1 family protein [Ktedonobacteraceae bacterium]